MHNPENITVEIDEQTAWLNEHRALTGWSWTVIASRIGVPKGTLSVFAGGNYKGDCKKIADAVYRYRQLLDSQAERAPATREAPRFIETPTAQRIFGLLSYAHRGRITVGGTGPGTGKTQAAREYKARASNVWIATMRPTTGTAAAMIPEVLKAIGGIAGRGFVRQMSAQVVDAVGGRNGLLVIDEANHCDIKALDEIRSWHDATGVGICLLGNEELIATIGGGRRHAFGRLNSRIAMRHVQDLPLPDDIEAFLDAWEIEDGAMRRMLATIAQTAGAGGLREIGHIIESASLLAFDDDQPLSLTYLRDAQKTRATSYIRTAA